MSYFDESPPAREPLGLGIEPISPAPRPSIKKVRYTHDAIIDDILLDPSVSQNELARRAGFTVTWMSIVINSDAFQERLAERKAELSDPKLVASINERLDGIARRSLDRIIERLDNPAAVIRDADLLGFAKLGVGDKNTRPAGPQVQQNLYVVSLPPKAPDSKAWLASSSPRGASQVIENVTGVNSFLPLESKNA